MIIKPLKKALEDQDHIYATIVSTGVNQDGHTEALPVPSREAQSNLIQRTLALGGIDGSMIQYIEAHGTGTVVGDPTEIEGLFCGLQKGRDTLKNRCFIGSIKSNIGHLEGAAGIAGIIKAALCLKHRSIPPSIHFQSPNPKISFTECGFEVPVRQVEFPRPEEKLYVGINSFGYGGTNAHAILSEAPGVDQIQIQQNKEQSHDFFPICLSGKSASALKDVVKKLLAFLHEENVTLGDLSYHLLEKRTQLEHRLFIPALSIHDLQTKLNHFIEHQEQLGCTSGEILRQNNQKCVFVYTGMGPQWWGMGRELFHSEPVFRKVIEDCDKMLQTMGSWSLIEEMMNRSEGESKIHKTEISQPANCALQIALTALLESWGVRCDAVCGHSIGEVAAAYTAGALNLQEAMLVSYHRSRLQAAKSGQGGMLSVSISEMEALQFVEAFPDELSIAAVNTEKSITFSGNLEVLNMLADEFEKNDVFAKLLRVEIAYHSFQMDDLKGELLNSLENLSPKLPTIPIYSTVTTELESCLDAVYWWNNMRQPVLFDKTIDHLVDQGYSIFVGVGPHPVLESYVQEKLNSKKRAGMHVSTLTRLKPEKESLYRCLGQLYVHGAKIDWQNLLPKTASPITLPNYPWQREHHLAESKEYRQWLSGVKGHSMLKREMESPYPCWEVEVSPSLLPWLEGHKLQSAVVWPGAAYVEAALQIHQAMFGKLSCSVREISFLNALSYDHKNEELLYLRFFYSPVDKNLNIYSRLHKLDQDVWTKHASAKIYESSFLENPQSIDLKKIEQELPHYIEHKQLYSAFQSIGLDYGPEFSLIDYIHYDSSRVISKIRAVDLHVKQNDLAYPPILDASFQSLIGLLFSMSRNLSLVVPIEIEQIDFFSSLDGELWVYGELDSLEDNTLIGNLYMCTVEGRICLRVKKLKCRLIEGAKGVGFDPEEQSVYQMALFEKPVQKKEKKEAKKQIVIAHDGDSFIEFKKISTCPSISAMVGTFFKKTDQDAYQFSPLEQKDIQLLLESCLSESHCDIVYLADSQQTLIHEGKVDRYRAEVMADTLLLHLTQCLQKWTNVDSKIYIVTRNTQNERESSSNALGASLWGMARTLQHECPELQIHLIDLDGSPNQYHDLVEEFTYTSESEVIFKNSHRFTQRLLKTPYQIERQEIEIPSDSPHLIQLVLKQPGAISSLTYELKNRRKPYEDELEVRVHTVSLNFKDLLKVFNVLDEKMLEHTYWRHGLGMELSGTVTHVGSKITKFKPGDEVFTPSRVCGFQNFVCVPEVYVQPVLSQLSLENTPISIAYQTVLRGLEDFAHLQKGETILIHAAAGAVGLAAIQYAQAVGARIIATVGSEKKKEYLHSIGVKYVCNSRNLTFVEQVLEWTGGQGVDVVLNSLANDFLIQSWNLLKPYGRFIEIGKKDIAENNCLPMNRFHRNLSFFALDLDQSYKDQPDLCVKLLESVQRGFKNGMFTGLPVKTYPAREVKEAFSYFAKGDHIGKVHVRYDQELIPITTFVESKIFKEDATYLITGGLRGFGLAIARWMVEEKGVKSLILLSKSGPVHEEAKEALKKFKEQGVQVLAEAVDVTDKKALEVFIENVPQTMFPIKGVMHGAMVLDDAPFTEMNPKRLEMVLGPKIAGVLNLSEIFSSNLDFFLLFSSISSLIGNVNQCNYAAANSFLDAFAQELRFVKNIPASVVNWGALAETGVLQRDLSASLYLEKLGVRGLSNEEAFWYLEKHLETHSTQRLIAKVDWDILDKTFSHGLEDSKFIDLIQKQDKKGLNEWLIHLKEISPEDREAKIVEFILLSLSNSLHIPREKMHPSQTFGDLGIDSLMKVEFQTNIEKKLQVRIPLTSIKKEISIKEIAEFLNARIKFY